LEVRESL